MDTISHAPNFTLGVFEDATTGIPMARIMGTEPDGTRVPVTGFFPCTQDEALLVAMDMGYAIVGHGQTSEVVKVTYYPLALLEY